MLNTLSATDDDDDIIVVERFNVRNYFSKTVIKIQNEILFGWLLDLLTIN